MIVPVILSGGEGKRLWPLSLPERPKQFLALTGPESLLQQTLRRLDERSMFTPPIIIGGAAQRFLIAEQLRATGLEVERIVLEPKGRNTGPALAVGALLAQALDPDALILSSHADHYIPDAEAFRATIARGVDAASAGSLVLFGLKPTYPATGYGYIEPGAAIGGEVRKVARFVEKPDEAAATRLVERGCLWNSGIFLMPAAGLIAEFEAHEPRVIAQARLALKRGVWETDFLRLDGDAFAAAPSISLDHAVMERTSRAAVVAADFAWSDIGAWSSVWDAQSKDEAGNVVRGRTILEDTSDSLIYAEGPQVAVLGVSGLVIVATPERVLVAAKDQDQKVRDLAARAEET
ncbi:MAG: mannose-1-phosphate guanylyltransferase/mannose-6-phosphate isomerase [Caulobacterales bacterium]